MDKFRDQSIRFGTRVVTETVSRVDLSSRPFKYWSDDPEPNTADAIIIATGASAKRLGLKGEDIYWQSGISACAVCDGAVPIFRFLFFQFVNSLTLTLSPSIGINLLLSSAEATQQLRKPHVGGKPFFFPPLSLIIPAYLSDLTKYGSHIYVLVRRGELKASKIMAKRLLNHPKIVSLSRFSHTHIVQRIFFKIPDSIVEHSCDRMPRRRRLTEQPPYKEREDRRRERPSCSWIVLRHRYGHPHVATWFWLI